MSDTLVACGGRKESLMGAAGDDPANDFWNFGVKPQTEAVSQLIKTTPTLYSRFPKMAGTWDGKSTVNHYEAVKKILGDKSETLIQYQPRGTCGGRAGSETIDFVQCIMIALGKRAKFHRCSHAAVYWAARAMFGMNGGDWRDDHNDGVPQGAVPKAMASIGVVQREEIGDLAYYGQGSDDLACQLGANMHPDIATKIKELAKDNVITSWSPVASAQELADGIAAGGVGIGADSQGFTMERDADGFCRPSGRWDHYQIRPSVGMFGTGGNRKGFGYWQSWNGVNDKGPRLTGHPGNCFGVDFDVQDRIVRSGAWAVVFGFPLWDLDNGPIDLPWVF